MRSYCFKWKAVFKQRLKTIGLIWSNILHDGLSVDEMTDKLYETIWPKFDASFPLIKVRCSSRDPPFMSPLVKHLLKKRKIAIKMKEEEAVIRLQNQIKGLIYANQVNAIQNEKNGSRKLWENVNNISGRKETTLPVSSVLEPNAINTHLQSITLILHKHILLQSYYRSLWTLRLPVYHWIKYITFYANENEQHADQMIYHTGSGISMQKYYSHCNKNI